MNPINPDQLNNGTTLTAVDRLAIRTSIASLEFLRQASEGLGVDINSLTAELLVKWLTLIDQLKQE